MKNKKEKTAKSGNGRRAVVIYFCFFSFRLSLVVAPTVIIFVFVVWVRVGRAEYVIVFRFNRSGMLVYLVHLSTQHVPRREYNAILACRSNRLGSFLFVGLVAPPPLTSSVIVASSWLLSVRLSALDSRMRLSHETRLAIDQCVRFS